MNTSSIDYQIDLKTLKELECIEKNRAVHVYVANWRNFQRVCVKKISNSDEVCNELTVLSKCIHPKIVQCLGVGTDERFTYILFEYMENGNLEDFLNNTKIDNNKKISLMIDISIGLHYLHNRDPEIVLHRDLKPSNILINKYGDAKISDFGISKLVNTQACDIFSGHTGEKGTYTWMSPEVLKHEDYNYKTDIYSLGLIFYFIWSEQKPFIEYKMNTIQLMFAKFQDKLEVNIKDNDILNNLISNCCAFDKELRPNVEQVIKTLQNLKNQ
jgi:serine/threonine protein kinase